MKVMTDEIIQEVWRAKDLIAKAFHYNVDELAAEMRSREKKSNRKFLENKGTDLFFHYGVL
jgi:hypothetical protein